MTEAYTSIPLSPLRRIIAQRLAETARSVPHFRLTVDIEMDALIELRREFSEQIPQARLSLNDFIIKACAATLVEVPEINIQWAGNEIHQYHHVDIAIITAIEGGLSTPIIRRAESKSVLEISREIKELTARASKNELNTEEIFGGTFSVSNLGMFGIAQFDAIINQPQCAILAIGAANPQVVVSSERRQRIATIMRATLSVDHRALDGKISASFLSVLKRQLEQPAKLRPTG